MNRFLLFPMCSIAAVLCSSALDAQTPSPIDEARAAMAARDFDKAANLLAPLTGEAGQDATAFHAASQVKLAQRKAEEAAKLAEKATQLDPTKAAYFSQLGMALGQRMGEVGFMQQAMMSGKLRKAFAKAVELDPNDLSGLIGLARFHTNAPEIAGGSIEKATEYATRVRTILPFLGELELGTIAEHEEQNAEALGHFEAAAKANPGHAWARCCCGRVLAKLGRKDEARARFDSALKIDPAMEPAKNGIAELDAAPLAVAAPAK